MFNGYAGASWELKAEIVAKLLELWRRDYASCRFGQFMSNISFDGIGEPDENMWNRRDEEWLELIEQRLLCNPPKAQVVE